MGPKFVRFKTKIATPKREKLCRNAGKSVCARPRTKGEKLTQAKPNGSIGNPMRVRLRRGGDELRCERSVTIITESNLERLCINSGDPKFAMSNAGNKDTDSGRDKPETSATDSVHERNLVGNGISRCARSTAGVADSRLAKLLMKSEDSRCARSGTEGEDTEPGRAMPNKNIANSRHKTLRNVKDKPRCKKSNMESGDPEYAKDLASNSTSR